MRRDRARRPAVVAWRVAPLLGLVVLSCVGTAPGEKGDSAAPLDSTGAGTAAWTDLSAGGAAACGRRDDRWECWGEASIAELPDAVRGSTALSLGPIAACGLTSAGAAQCWGEGRVANLDPPSETEMLVVEVGWEAACVLGATGDPRCWGDTGEEDPRYVPLPSGAGLVALELGTIMACGLDATGMVTCWGMPDNGGVPILDPPFPGPWTDIAVGTSYACGISAGRVWCWGYSYAGAADAPRLRSQAEVDSTGSDGTCALDEAGGVECWGTFWRGSPDGVPPSLPPDDYAQIAVGSEFLCGLTTDGEIHCAGDNSEGQLDVPE